MRRREDRGRVPGGTHFTYVNSLVRLVPQRKDGAALLEHFPHLQGAPFGPPFFASATFKLGHYPGGAFLDDLLGFLVTDLFTEDVELAQRHTAAPYAPSHLLSRASSRGFHTLLGRERMSAEGPLSRSRP